MGIVKTILARSHFKLKPNLPKINLVPCAQRHPPASVRGNVNPPSLAEQSGPDRTAVVEDTPFSGRRIETYVRMSA